MAGVRQRLGPAGARGEGGGARHGGARRHGDLAQTALPSPATGKGAVPGGKPAPAGAAGAVVAAGGAAALQSNEPVVIVLLSPSPSAPPIGAFVLWRWWRKRRQEAPRQSNQLKQQHMKETIMDNFLIFGGFAAAGYVLAIYTWPAVRTFFAGAEQEIAWLKSRARRTRRQGARRLRRSELTWTGVISPRPSSGSARRCSGRRSAARSAPPPAICWRRRSAPARRHRTR